MAAEIPTPLDESTHIPLPILPREMLPVDNPQIANRHHHWHPSTAPELQTLGGKALRVSRIQLVRITDHNVRGSNRPTYHDIYQGPILPNNDEDLFKLCVLQCAGYIPTDAIDLSGGEPKRVTMNDYEMSLLRATARPRTVTPQRILKLSAKAATSYDSLIKPTLGKDQYVEQFVQGYISQREVRAGFSFHHLSYGYDAIRAFFRAYALSQDISGVRELEIEEFLGTSDSEKKRFLGHKLLAYAIEGATDKVEPLYREAREAGLLHPLMPRNPRILVRNKLGPTQQREQVAVELEHRLRQQYGQAA